MVEGSSDFAYNNSNVQLCHGSYQSICFINSDCTIVLSLLLIAWYHAYVMMTYLLVNQRVFMTCAYARVHARVFNNVMHAFDF